MAIYRAPKPRWPLAAAALVAGLLVGIVVGIVVTGEPTAAETAAQVRARLVGAAGSVEVAAIEYEESVANGDVTAAAEYEGALAAIASAEEAYAEVADAVAALAPERDEAITAGFAELRSTMEERQDATEVSRMAEALSELLKD